jgi:type IV fimbrial biogenesis protein FimT
MSKTTIRFARGFTLVEVCVSMTIAGILAASALPSFLGLLERQRMQAVIHDLTIALSLARTEAVASGRRVAVAPRTADDWSAGWYVFVDANDNGTLDHGEAILQQALAAHPSISITPHFGSTRQVVLSYGATGFSRRPGSNALLMGRLLVSNGRSNQVVCFGATRVRVADGTRCS